MSNASVDIRAGARPGDWIAVHQIGGGVPRRGEVIEVLGQPGHEHYRVRWDDEHESIHFPTEGTSIERRPVATERRRSRPGR
ncbi:MAG TPA: DUF1918 domain-containing protein [Solirubrobacteraceae bacterium]|nr:DUF1918 domain-containing protein [Solirubrobacteraceae bacterium]